MNNHSGFDTIKLDENMQNTYEIFKSINYVILNNTNILLIIQGFSAKKILIIEIHSVPNLSKKL